MESFYMNTPQEWDYKQCLKIANKTARDGLGTPYPWKGYIGSHFGGVRYNGGCVKGDKWYRGEHFPLPLIDPAFEIIHVPTWGYRLIKKEEDNVST